MQQEISEPQHKNHALSVFQSLGYTAKSLITKDQFKEILDLQSKKANGLPFKQQIFDEFWEQSQANSRGQVQVGTVASVMLEANSLLNNKVQRLGGPRGLIAAKKEELRLQEEELMDSQQHNYDDDVRINRLRRQITGIQINLNEYQEDFREFSKEKNLINDFFVLQEKKEISIYEEPLPVKSEYSVSLLIAFHLTNICFLLELLICTYRLNFLAILVFLQIYFFLFVGYFSEHSVAYLLLQLGGSIFLDLAWIVLSIFTSIYVAPERHSDNSSFFVAVIVLMLIENLLKAGLLFKLLPYRQFSKGSEYFVLLGEKVWLNKRAQHAPSFRKSQFTE